MNRRHGIAAGVVALTVGIAVADTSPPKRASGLTGPISVFKESDKFDLDFRPFALWDQPITVAHIHRELVNEFIRRPGAGVSRMMPVVMPREWVELVPDSLSETHSATAGAKPQPPRYDMLTETLTLADGSKRTMQERVWLLRDQRLMSVDAKSGPAVYLLEVKPEHDLMKEKPVATGKNTPTRKLDDFETKALTRIRDGQDVVLQSSEDEMRVLGAIRARQQCLECHTTKVGSLLGAFSYTLSLQSYATPESECLKETAGLSRSVVAAVRHVESLGGKAIRAAGGPISEVDFTFSWKQHAELAAKGKTPPRQMSDAFSARLKNSALAVLESFPDLRVLDISHSLVTDDGLKEVAKHKKLQKVYYTQGYVTDAGVAALKKALPDCTVEVKHAVMPPTLP